MCTTRFNTQNSTFCPHSVFMCFVWIWEQTAIISLYSINWLVFITETECVYCAARTGSLYTASLTFSNSTFCPHSVFMCCVWIWEQTAIISLYSINWPVFITDMERVYCSVRTECLYTIQVIFWSLRGYAVTAAQHIHQSLKAGDFDARPRCKLHTLLSHHRRARYCHATQCNRTQFRTACYAVTQQDRSVCCTVWPSTPITKSHFCSPHAPRLHTARADAISFTPSLHIFSWNSRTNSSFTCRSLIANFTQTGQYCGRYGRRLIYARKWRMAVTEQCFTKLAVRKLWGHVVHTIVCEWNKKKMQKVRAESHFRPCVKVWLKVLNLLAPELFF